MIWHTNSAFIALRKFARQAGLTKYLMRTFGKRGYEHAFERALFSAVLAGDTVWDVGANVGYYTKRFSDAVGPHGYVVGFEPFPATAQQLKTYMQGVLNYSHQTIALGAASGIAKMKIGPDFLGATSRIVQNAVEGVTIEMDTADGVLDRGIVPTPTVVKIDTEGCELDVLHGMNKLLTSPKLRALFVEVHFGLLAERGQPKAPAEIERLLKVAGFTVRWVDPSHIAAIRA